MVDDDFLQDERLRVLYANTAGPIAFLDESFRQDAAEGYYTMTGVMFDRTNMVDHRRRFLTIGKIPGFAHWHTTEVYRAGAAYHGNIRRFVEAIGQRSEWAITTIETPLSGGSRHAMEKARAACLEKLLREFSRGPHGARVFVLDKLDEHGMDADTRLAQRLVRDGELPHYTRLRHSTAEHEPLLDAPDTMSWAARQLLAHGDPRWIANAQDQVSIIHLATGKHLNVPELVQKHNSARAAAADHPAPDLEQPSRVPYSPLLPPSVSHQRDAVSTPNTPTPASTPLADLIAKAAVAAGASAVRQATEQLREIRSRQHGGAQVEHDQVGAGRDPALEPDESIVDHRSASLQALERQQEIDAQREAATPERGPETGREL